MEAWGNRVFDTNNGQLYSKMKIFPILMVDEHPCASLERRCNSSAAMSRMMMEEEDLRDETWSSRPRLI